MIVSQSLAQRMFPNMDAVNRRLMWTDPVTKFIGVSNDPRRIVGVVPDIDDENIVPVPTMTMYHPMEQEMNGGRLFVHAKMDPYRWSRRITRIIRDLASDQPVERAQTLDDVRAEVLSPNRVNALVFSGFAGVALAIAVVGVAGVLAFSVSARTREFGVRLAIGATPSALLARILKEGALIGVSGIAAGVIGGLILARVVSRFIAGIEIPGAVPLAGAALVLIAAAPARVVDAGGAGGARRGDQRAARGLSYRDVMLGRATVRTMRGPMSTSQRRVSRRVIGSRVGSYEILSLLGSRRDGRRSIVPAIRCSGGTSPIKLLPSAALRADPDRLARFSREARLLRGVESSAHRDHSRPRAGRWRQRALVMELVEGPTLGRKIATQDSRPAPAAPGHSLTPSRIGEPDRRGARGRARTRASFIAT